MAKEKYQMPNSTLVKLLRIFHELQQKTQIVGVLSSLNDLRNKNFRHGRTTQFRAFTQRSRFHVLDLRRRILLLTRLP